MPTKGVSFFIRNLAKLIRLDWRPRNCDLPRMRLILFKGAADTTPASTVAATSAAIKKVKGEIVDQQKLARGYRVKLAGISRAIKSRLAKLKELKANKQVPVYIMQQVNDCFGAINQGEIQSIWLELLSENQQKLTIGGRANTFNDVSELWNRLNDNPVFENVTLGQTIKESDTIRFTLNTTIIPEHIQIDSGASEPGAGDAPAPAA